MLQSLQAFPNLSENNQAIALVENTVEYSYHDLNLRIIRCASGLLDGKPDLVEERIAFIIPASLDYVTVLHGIWRAGGIAIPINTSSAEAELEHYLSNASVTRMIINPSLQKKVSKLCKRLNVELLTVDNVLARNTGALPTLPVERRAMILFTSGTTNKPKGVVITHGMIEAQVTTLVTAWGWSKDDVIPAFLPLHHIHGIINVLNCALWSGATVHLMPKLDVPAICAQVANDTFTVFMAVPTVYVKLIDYLEQLNADQAKQIRSGYGRMRLNVSGSAACPVKVFDQWQELTGQVLLERYGMTEIGMGISNPYQGERRAGYVGQALPGVTVQLFDEDESPVNTEKTPGEIRIKGANVFSEYWGNKKATEESFKDGWFCSGDIAVIEDGYIRIMGRSSIDIIKSGGYKLSALEIEGVLLTHDDINEVAVIGVADDTWGESVAAVIGLKENTALDLAQLKQWCEGKMSAYKIPKQLKVLDALPRNAMGKVTKPALKELL